MRIGMQTSGSHGGIRSVLALAEGLGQGPMTATARTVALIAPRFASGLVHERTAPSAQVPHGALSP